MKKRYLLYVLIFLLCHVMGNHSVWAAEEAEEEMDTTEILNLFDFGEADEALSQTDGEISFSGLVAAFCKGDFNSGMDVLKEAVIQTFFSELVYQKAAWVKIFMLAILSAMVTNISVILEKREISEIGFFITYLVLAGSVIAAFSVIAQMISKVTGQMLSFVKIAIPSVVLSVGISCGQATALGFGEIALFVIYVGELVINNVILPAVTIYVVLMVINHLLPEDYLSKFGGMFQSFTLWFLKSFTAIVMGMNIIKGMLLPGIDAAGKNTVVRLINMIPGSDVVTGAGSIFLSSAIVVKNAIGGAVIVGMVMIAALPCVKMAVFILTYKISAALIQPMADKRVAGCVESVADGVVLLGKVLITEIVMMALTMAILCLFTT
jgi:stage III sporulation protein AE